MKVFKPTPSAALEDMVTLVAVMVKAGVAARAGEAEIKTPHVRSDPARRRGRWELCVAENLSAGGFVCVLRRGPVPMAQVSRKFYT